MTGHGEAHGLRDGVSVTVEVRTVNSRYFKLSVRAGDGFAALEPRIDALVRKHVRRGTVQVVIRLDRQPDPGDFQLNATVLAGYRKQLEAMYDQLHIADTIHLEALLALPGVVNDRPAVRSDAERDWPLIEETLQQALEGLTRMRTEEGLAMAADLRAQRQAIGEQVEQIASRAPLVVESYRGRLTERLKQLLSEYDVSVDASDVVREVGIFAERSDISEELVRLRSHLDQFAGMLESTDSNGRKLEFLTQELLRETNTVGSKANDAQIARHVIDVKASIERIREMIQNVE